MEISVPPFSFISSSGFFWEEEEEDREGEGEGE
jgi:hypothetical protein